MLTTSCASLAALFALSCGEQTSPQDVVLDETPPNLEIIPSSDTVDINEGLQVTLLASDNLSLKNIRLTVTGAAQLTFDTTFTATQQSFSAVFEIVIGAGAGGFIDIDALAVDGADNETMAVDSVFIFDPAPPEQLILSPAEGNAFGVGTTVDVIVRTTDPSAVVQVGARIFRTDAIGTKTIFSADTANLAAGIFASTDTLTVLVPDTLQPGDYLLGVFATDGVGNSGDGPAIQIGVADLAPPSGVFLAPALDSNVVSGDSVLVVFQVLDGTGVDSLFLEGFAVRGDANLGTADTVVRFERWEIDLPAPTDTTLNRYFIPPGLDSLTETVFLRATILDVGGNVTVVVTRIQALFISGPALTILAPPDSSIIAPGKTMTITIQGQTISGVGKLGYITGGVFTSVDTASAVMPVTNPQVEDTTVSFTVTIPAATALGFFTIDPFGRDSAGNIGAGGAITVEVVASTGIGDTIPPLVTDSLDLRSEAGDSIKVRATDVGGITKIGFIVADEGTGATMAGDSVSFAGTATDLSQSFVLGLDTVTTFPRLVVVTAFAEDSVGNRGGLSLTGIPVAASAGAADTLTIVAGRTIPLPSGGRVADAIYNRNLNEVYLTNIDLDRLEIFDVATVAFDPFGIPVGSKPWGIALWPLDTLGANADTVMVANSGGTNISIVDVAARTEKRRHALPNFLIEEVSIEIVNTEARLDIISHDFSDRPQFLAAICRVTDGDTNCHADSVYAVYSTTPTIDQSELFELRGTVRWENISTTVTPQSHFFWEHASGVAALDFDTLQITVSRRDTILGGTTQEILLSAACGEMVSITDLGFLDTTFVRNSGNFTHAFIGEGGAGGPVRGFARALRYRLADIVTGTCTATIAGVTLTGGFQSDSGVSPSIDVSDFISNTAIGVKSIAVNFNGLTNLVRADSIYVLDENLRPTGIIGALGENAGMDLNFDHTFDANSGGTPGTDGGSLLPNDRFVFAARDDANIDVFDTWFFARVATVPVKDPIIGPLRVAKLPTGEQFLIGVSARGVITVTLPAITNTFPAPIWGAPIDWTLP